MRFISRATRNVIHDIVEQSELCQQQVRAHNIQRDEDEEIQYCPRILLILDDCIDSNVLNFRGANDMIAERGRHIKITAIYTSQRESAVSKSIRINADYYIIFSPFAIAELEKFVERMIPKSRRKELLPLLESLFEQPYHFLLVDNDEREWNKKLKWSTAEQLMEGRYEYLFTTSQ